MQKKKHHLVQYTIKKQVDNNFLRLICRCISPHLRYHKLFNKNYQKVSYNCMAITRRKGVLRNFAKFTRKYLCQSLLFNKVAGLRLWHRCFPVNFAKFLRTLFSIEHLWWLLLHSKSLRSNHNKRNIHSQPIADKKR